MRAPAAALGVLFVIVTGCSSTQYVTEPAGGTSGGNTGTVYSDLVVFTTKASFKGDLGGISGADAKCNTYAKAAGLTGKFQAWLSDSKTDAISRVPNAGPWRILDKEGKQSEIAFDNKEAWEGYPKVNVNNTEFGKTLSQLSTSTTTEIPYTWTGTQLGGKKKGCHCADWTSAANFTENCPGSDYGGLIGSREARKNDQEWTDYGSNPCNAESGILCYQVP